MRAAVSEYAFVTANSLPAALELLSAGEGWRPIAGGTDLMVLFNAGTLPYRRLVNVCAIPDLRGIEVSDARVDIGAATTYTEIRNHSVLQTEFPLLCQAASWTGGRANQNRGTLGGNIANASPAADSAPMLLVYEAQIELTSAKGSRWVPYAKFHLAYKTVEMRTDELITRIRLPLPVGSLVQYARKVGTRKAQAISKVCFAGACHCGDGILGDVRIAVGSVAPIPLRCFLTESVLENCRPTADVIAEAKQMLCREIRPITDIRSTGQYRTQVSLNLLHEFLESAG